VRPDSGKDYVAKGFSFGGFTANVVYMFFPYVCGHVHFNAHYV